MTRGRPRIVGAWWNRFGVTREVALNGNVAIKLPKLTYGWKMFLCGLLANMQEREFSTLQWPELCPVIFAIPGGWLIVMRRARELTDAEWAAFDAESFCKRPDGTLIPAEFKSDSFGKLDGKFVAVDYGN